MMFKKIVMLLMLLTLLFALGGCGNGVAEFDSSLSSAISSNESEALPNSSSVSESNMESSMESGENVPPASTSSSESGTASQEIIPSASTSASSSETGTALQENDDPPTDGSSPVESDDPDEAVLIAYFSWSGNTQQLANMIQEQTGGDLFQIEMETPYTDNEGELSGLALQEQRDNTRPALSTYVENMDEYKVVFIGYPNWWNNMPMPVFTFLEEYDFSGKTVIPFTTYGDGGFGRSVISIKEILSDATIADGIAIQEHTLADAPAQVSEWLQSLGIER